MSSATRESKRRKAASHNAERARLVRLNALPAASFQQQHIPPEWLLFRRSRGGAKADPRAPHPLKQQEEQHALAFYPANALPAPNFRRCFALLRQTSEAHYRRSARGWDPEGKKAEMLEENMRYLVVGDRSDDASADDTPPSEDEDVDDFGYLSFMLDEDDEVEDPDRLVLMLYVYEVHLGRNLRGIGLGRHLMKLVEHVARSTGMHKVELSVSSGNEVAEKFYRHLGFETDETSPAPRVLRAGKSVKPEWCVLSLSVSTDDGENASDHATAEDHGRPRKVPRRIQPTLLS
jgi:ribosomal protein S18 acetylase RimI-like enzyme